MPKIDTNNPIYIETVRTRRAYRDILGEQKSRLKRGIAPTADDLQAVEKARTELEDALRAMRTLKTGT